MHGLIREPNSFHSDEGPWHLRASGGAICAMLAFGFKIIIFARG